MKRLHHAFHIVILAFIVFTLIGPGTALAHDTDGDIFYTASSGNDRVFKRMYDFNGSSVNYGTESTISGISNGLGGADGIVFDPTDTNFLLVGGQNDRVYRVNANTGAVTASSPTGAGILHLAIDPSGTSVWGSWIPGNPIANVSLTPFSSSVSTLPISGSVGAVTGLAFDGSGNAYYTSSGAGGFGSFGTINMSTGVTSQLFGSVAAAHGLSFDPFTGDFILFGDGQVSQYDPVTNSFVSTYFGPGQQFDQGAVDGKGHLFGASNTGNMLFVDYQSTGLIGDASNFSNTQFFRSSLDDVAPLSGLGSGGGTVIPEPSSLLLVGLGSALGLGLRARRRQLRKK